MATISDPDDAARGVAPIRQFNKCDESKILRIRSDLSFTWLDMFDMNTSNCFMTDSNDQLTAETLAFSSYKKNLNNL